MFGRELDPEQYTIDCYGVYGHDVRENVLGAIGQQIVATCEMYNFAVVKGAFSDTDFPILQADAMQLIAKYDHHGQTQQVIAKGVRGVHKTPETDTQFSPAAQQIVATFVQSIFAASTTSRLMRTEHSTIDTAFVARYAPGGRVGKHFDETSGVVIETALAGAAEMKIWAKQGWMAHVALESNVTVIMPGLTAGSQGRADLVAHAVRNVTPTSMHRGYRLGMTYIYGRLSGRALRAKLHSLNKVWHNNER